MTKCLGSCSKTMDDTWCLLRSCLAPNLASHSSQLYVFFMLCIRRTWMFKFVNWNRFIKANLKYYFWNITSTIGSRFDKVCEWSESIFSLKRDKRSFEKLCVRCDFWANKKLTWLKDFLHKSHSNGFRLSWTAWPWINKDCLDANASWHVPQTKGLSGKNNSYMYT